MKRLVLYTRPECHLCESLLEALRPLIAGRATLEAVDVTDDVALERRYGQRVPVLATADGEELSSHPLDRRSVERYLAP